MYRRDHHVQIAAILQALDPGFLARNHCYFGGGTAIVLTRDEYRESVDIDFLVSDLAGYQTIRNELTSGRQLRPLLREGASLTLVREIRADQYGVRTMVRVGSSEIKFEIVLEARVAFEPPTAKDRICGVATLTALDLATSKLLANSDRWADDSVYSRDLIDLAMLALPKKAFEASVAKASRAYGESVVRDLARAIQRMGERTGRLDECMEALKIHDVPKALLWKRIRQLRPLKGKRSSP